ncbi:hypothetical protein [Rhodoferax sp.]|uniref:hypothetical protein n=1 Tax=Rhodoferax sp. TaxID=50421 RepID=UPI0026135AE4|nr:hypothetical protein [Rhodoferax sp.]MDD2919977.1 hypothetical protein [Rhodoferax sp.]
MAGTESPTTVITTMAWPPGCAAKALISRMIVWKFECPKGTYCSRRAESGMSACHSACALFEPNLKSFEALFHTKLLPETKRQVFGFRSPTFGKTLPAKPAKL